MEVEFERARILVDRAGKWTGNAMDSADTIAAMLDISRRDLYDDEMRINSVAFRDALLRYAAKVNATR